MDAPSGQMHQSEYANLVLYFCYKRLVLCFGYTALAPQFAQVLKMGAEPEAAQIMRSLGVRKEAENGSHNARVSREPPARLPGRPEQDWGRVF